MPDMKDLIWIEDAAKQYGRSPKWLRKQVDDGRLSYVQIPGDRRLYLVRSELDAMFNVQPQRKEPAAGE